MTVPVTPPLKVNTAMAQTHIYTDTAFPADLEWQAVSLIRIEWPFAFGGAKRLGRRVRTEHDPVHETIAHVVIEEQRVLMSYATIIGTRIVHQHETYQAYGLSSVFTYPNFRGEGVGQAAGPDGHSPHPHPRGCGYWHALLSAAADSLL